MYLYLISPEVAQVWIQVAALEQNDFGAIVKVPLQPLFSLHKITLSILVIHYDPLILSQSDFVMGASWVLPRKVAKIV